MKYVSVNYLTTRGTFVASLFLFLSLLLIAANSMAADSSPSPVKIEIKNKKSLIHMGSVDSTTIT